METVENTNIPQQEKKQNSNNIMISLKNQHEKEH